jgi:uncharacterized integral membrane protein (TIGR00697 family)
MNQPKFKLLPLFIMLYLAIGLADITSIYRLTTFGELTTTAGVYIIPFYYFLEDMIAEIYGYERFRQIAWCTLIVVNIFAFIVTAVNQLPSPGHWSYNESYRIVFSEIIRVTLGGSCIAMMTGVFLNAYFLSRWKIYFYGRYFWFRSVGASIIAQGIQSVIGNTIFFIGILPFSKIVSMISINYFIKISIYALIAIPGGFIIRLLKHIEEGDIYDHNINYNPFSLKITTQLSKSSNE